MFLYADKFDSLCNKQIFLKYNLPKLMQGGTENLNRELSSKEIEFAGHSAKALGESV